ncbi:MAG TPA: serine hydrolase [Candidatus Limnocylindrales bacterium]|nr:serine hydrolase [Candidatus Limnocylindrales bacterium]
MRRVTAAVLSLFAATAVAAAAEPLSAPPADPGASSVPVDAGRARAFLASIKPSSELQSFLDRSLAEIGRSDAKLLASAPRIAVIDLRDPSSPVLAAVRGDQKVYPASVVKFVYLMAAYAWQERGRLRIDPALDAELSAMIRESSNKATQKVFSRITGTEPGPELGAEEYRTYRDRRLAVKGWLQELGIDDLHAVSPTYDGGGDLFGRDQQFLRDRTVAGGLAVSGGEFPNRQAMTASGTARLLALLATDRALTPADSETVRRRMRRDVREQPHLLHRIAGGASSTAGVEVYSKSGTWGPIYADAGIVRDPSGREFVLAFFTDASPPYRGDGIALVTRRLIDHLFGDAGKAAGGPP